MDAGRVSVTRRSRRDDSDRAAAADARQTRHVSAGRGRASQGSVSGKQGGTHSCGSDLLSLLSRLVSLLLLCSNRPLQRPAVRQRERREAHKQTHEQQGDAYAGTDHGGRGTRGARRGGLKWPAERRWQILIGEADEVAIPIRRLHPVETETTMLVLALSPSVAAKSSQRPCKDASPFPTRMHSGGVVPLRSAVSCRCASFRSRACSSPFLPLHLCCVLRAVCASAALGAAWGSVATRCARSSRSQHEERRPTPTPDARATRHAETQRRIAQRTARAEKRTVTGDTAERAHSKANTTHWWSMTNENDIADAHRRRDTAKRNSAVSAHSVTRLCRTAAAMSSSAQLASPLLDPSGAHGADKSGLAVDGHGYHAIVPVSTTAADGNDKFGEYISRAKARANNTLKVCCGLPHRYTMLLCIMFLTFGSYWCYDIPGSIETQLILWFNNGSTDGSYTKASNSLLYSIYSWPNCILAFFGGFLLDKVTGVRRGALLFCGLVALGQLIFSLGCQYKIFYLAFFGRFVFGLGGESLTVAQNTFTVRWFDGKRLALAFGLVVAFSRIGTSVNFVVSPKLANSNDGVPLTVWFGMGMCALSYIACMCASALDFWGEKKVEDQRQIYMSTLSEEEAVYVRRLDELAEPVGDDISFKMITRIPGTAWLLFLITAVFYVVRNEAYTQSNCCSQLTRCSRRSVLQPMFTKRPYNVPLSVCVLTLVAAGHS